eukprot:15467654-Alexandrium_andersonii.AAC.1
MPCSLEGHGQDHLVGHSVARLVVQLNDLHSLAQGLLTRPFLLLTSPAKVRNGPLSSTCLNMNGPRSAYMAP